MAHGDAGAIDPVLVAQADGRLAIDVQVVLTYANDGERAEGATVTAVAVRPDGTVTPAVALGPASAPGAYVGTVEVPSAGDWLVRIEATTPTASLDVPSVVVALPATTTTTTVATTTTASTVAAAEDDGGDNSAVPTIGLLVVVAIGAAIGYRMSRRARRE